MVSGWRHWAYQFRTIFRQVVSGFTNSVTQSRLEYGVRSNQSCAVFSVYVLFTYIFLQ